MGSVEGSRDLIIELFRDMHEYPFPVWKDKTIAQKASFTFCMKLAWEQSRSLPQACNIENALHWLVLMGGGLQGDPTGPPHKGSSS